MSMFAVMKGKNLTLLYTIKKEKIKQTDETGEKANNQLSGNVQSEGDGVLCTSVKVYRRAWTESWSCIFLHELLGMFIYNWSF